MSHQFSDVVDAVFNHGRPVGEGRRGVVILRVRGGRITEWIMESFSAQSLKIKIVKTHMKLHLNPND